jgi:hypothetical protein
MQRAQKITLGEMRQSGTRLIVYRADYRCAHSVLIDAADGPSDYWRSGSPISGLEAKTPGRDQHPFCSLSIGVQILDADPPA